MERLRLIKLINSKSSYKDYTPEKMFTASDLKNVQGAKRATIIFDDNDEVSEEELGFGAEPIEKQEVTYSKTVRTTNHVANQLNSLTKIGLGKTVSEVIQSLIDSKLDSLPDSTKIKYDMLLDIVEKKDFLTHK